MEQPTPEAETFRELPLLNQIKQCQDELIKVIDGDRGEDPELYRFSDLVLWMVGKARSRGFEVAQSMIPEGLENHLRKEVQ